jgi:hypothetical protein
MAVHELNFYFKKCRNFLNRYENIGCTKSTLYNKEFNLCVWPWVVQNSENFIAFLALRIVKLIFVALRPNADHGLLILEVFYITHNDAPQSVGLLWTSDQLVAETSTIQHTTFKTNIHTPGGIQTHDLSGRAAADLRFRPRGH